MSNQSSITATVAIIFFWFQCVGYIDGQWGRPATIIFTLLSCWWIMYCGTKDKQTRYRERQQIRHEYRYELRASGELK